MQRTLDGDDARVRLQDIDLHYKLVVSAAALERAWSRRTLRKPERHEVNTVREKCGASVNELAELHGYQVYELSWRSICHTHLRDSLHEM